MALADSLIKTADGLLTKYGPFNGKVVYKRVITRTGGDNLIGRPGSVTTSDTELTPQPFFSRSGKRNVVVDNTRFQDVITVAGRETVEVYDVLISITAMSQSEMADKDTVIVLKDSSTNEESILYIEDFDPIALNDTIVLWKARAKSIKRS